MDKKRVGFPFSNSFKKGMYLLMTKNIYANLDLSKSLEVFKVNVTKLLELIEEEFSYSPIQESAIFQWGIQTRLAHCCTTKLEFLVGVQKRRLFIHSTMKFRIQYNIN